MLKATHKQVKSKKVDIRSTQEILISKPLTEMPIFITNIPEKNDEKMQRPANKSAR